MNYSGNDFQVVPDDGYGSPHDYPYYNASSMASPAGSTASSAVDSAFDELAEVIPELIDTDSNFTASPMTYQDISVLSPYESQESSDQEKFGCSFSENGLQRSPNMYEAASPSISNSDYEEAWSPSSTHLIKAVKQASTKRGHSPDDTDAGKYVSSDLDQPLKKRKMTDSEAIARYAEVLLCLDAQKKNKKSEKMFFYPQNEDSGIGMSLLDSKESSDIKSTDLAQEKAQQPLLNLDDDILTNNFAVLAEYLNSDLNALNNRISSDANNNYVVIKKEEASFPGSSMPEPIIQEVPEIVTTKPLESYSIQPPVVDSPPLSGTKNRSKDVPKPAASISWCKGAVPRADGVIFFQVPNQVAESKDLKKTTVASSVETPTTVNVEEWMGQSRQRRPGLISRSSKPRLYNFLQELLHDSRYKCIEWVDKVKGIFKFIDSGEVARFWGQRKNKPNMKYENFARSLRTYIAKGILTKPRNKLVYQFTADYL